ncbi:MAG: carboxypeptidase-like regulatory domain-containing protein [Acidobacteriia bacterium]|nr:carboxypeptidase-like regulatory domain-containing protein [Terriglobia bacterium]
MNTLVRYMCTLLVFTCSMTAQERFSSGPWKGFFKEQPELNTIELPKPFKVSSIKGKVVYSGREKLRDAFFEIRDKSGRVLTATTDENGEFTLAHVPRGTYDFRVSKNEFKPVIGKVMVSRRWWKSDAIIIPIELGN